MATKKIKASKFEFGVYTVKATLEYEDDLDLNHYMDKKDWDKLSDLDRESKLLEIIEENCIGDIDYEYVFDCADEG
jgi:hypothetical protein